MKQKTRRYAQRVAAGILASLLTLSGIGAAHAGEKGKLLTECKPYTIYTFGYGDGNNVDGGTWNITGENLNGNRDDSFEIPVNRPDIPHLSDEEFSTDSADYHLQWVQELYYQSEYVATTDNCTFIHGYQFQPSLTINAHQGVTLTEETVRADLRKQYPNVLGHSLDYYFPQFVVQSPTQWVNPGNNYYHVDERIQLDGSVHVFNLHRIGQPAKHGQTPAAFGFKDTFFRFPHNSNRVEKLEGDTWVTVARTPFVFETVTNLANRGVVMVESDRRTSHFVRFEDLTRGDLSHAVTSTAAVDFAGEQVSPFSDNGFNNQGLYTVDASQILHRDSELVDSGNLSGAVDDISRQLGESLPQLLSTSLEYTWAIPANATPEKTVPQTVGVRALSPVLATEERQSAIRYEVTPEHSDGRSHDVTFTLIYEGNNWVKEKQVSKHITLSDSAQTVEFTPADFGWDTAPEHYGFQPGTYTYELTAGDFHIRAYSDANNETVVSPQGMSTPQTREATEQGKTYHVHTNASVASGYYQYTITDTVNTSLPFTVSNYRVQFPQADMTNEFTVDTSESGKVIARWNHDGWEVPAGAITVDYDLTFQKTPDTMLTRTVNVDNGFETVGTQSAFPQPVEVSFDVNGGEGSLPGVEVTPFVPSKVSLFTPPARAGYQFMGWALTADGETVAQVTPHAAVTLFAQWKKAIPATVLTPAHKTKRTVTFTSDEPCPASKKETAVDGDRVTTPVFTCDGYQLTGWDVHSNQGVAKVEQTPFTVTVKGNMTLVALWRKAIPQTVLTPAHKTGRVVRFHSNDKRNTVITVHAVDGDTVSLKTGLTRDGYVLAGWATRPESSTLAYPVTGRLTVDGDRDLYAVWKPVSEPVKPSSPSQKPSRTPSQKTVHPAGEQRLLASTGSTVSSIALLAMVLVTVGLSTVLLVRRRQ